MVEIIKVDGYKSFRGKMRIVPKNGMQPFVYEKKISETEIKIMTAYEVSISRVSIEDLEE